jgi:hypothetical protein
MGIEYTDGREKGFLKALRMSIEWIRFFWEGI